MDLINPAAVNAAAGTAVAGGTQLLNRTAFASPPTGRLGNSGRNAFRGPGFYNLDLSLGRTFSLRWLGESGRITLRADAFNFLNHANLNIPDNFFNRATFGIARFGRAGAESGLPVLSPVNDTSRQIQLILRIQF